MTVGRGGTSPERVSHYQLIAPTGRDGEGEIHRARDLRLDREVAIRLLRPEAMVRPGSLERFRVEARIASLVTHPHICAVHDSGEEGGLAYLVCELLEGRALDEVIAGVPLPPERALDIVSQTAEALAAAHRRGIVHGTVKPSNVFITSDAHVKLLELGAAAAASGDTPRGATGSATTAVHAGAAGHLARN